MKVLFVDAQEIRMGSPFNICNVSLEDSKKLRLPARPWQDVHASRVAPELHALVYWAIEQNEPGFRVVICNPNTGEMFESRRFDGCCSGMEWDNERLRVAVHNAASFYLNDSAT